MSGWYLAAENVLQIVCRPCENSMGLMEATSERVGSALFSRFGLKSRRWPLGRSWEDRHGRFCHETMRFGPLSCGDGRHHLVHAENVERSPQIVDERRQAEFSAHFFQAAHQERALIHPLLDAAERMFDRLATAVENFR